VDEIPEWSDLAQQIRSAIDNNEWSIMELNSFLKDLDAFMVGL